MLVWCSKDLAPLQESRRHVCCSYCSALLRQCITLQFTVVQCTALQYRAVHCSTVQCTTVQGSAHTVIHCTAVLKVQGQGQVLGYWLQYTIYYILYNVYCKLFTVYCIQYTVYCILYVVNCILYIVSCILATNLYTFTPVCSQDGIKVSCHY